MENNENTNSIDNQPVGDGNSQPAAAQPATPTPPAPAPEAAPAPAPEPVAAAPVAAPVQPQAAPVAGGKTPNAMGCMIFGIVAAATSWLIIPGFIFGFMALGKRKKDHPTVLANPGMYKASEVHMKVGFGLAWLGLGLSMFWILYVIMIAVAVS
jgi:hypothetical protein